MEYRLLHKEGDWKVYDIIIEGVSLVNNYRTQFNTIITKDSYGAREADALETRPGERWLGGKRVDICGHSAWCVSRRPRCPGVVHSMEGLFSKTPYAHCSVQLNKGTAVFQKWRWRLLWL